MDRLPPLSWILVGGRRHGHQLLEALIADGLPPSSVFVLQEDPHELEKHSVEMVALCSAHSIAYQLTKKLERKDADRIARSAPRLMVVMGWRTLIAPALLRIPSYGSVALHDSLLPRYRGFAPVNWAIINGERETGISLFYMEEGVDSGPIIAQERIEIGQDDTAAQLYGRVTEAAVAMMRAFVPRLLQGRLPSTAQDPALATFTCSRTPDDGRIDWSAPTRIIYDLVRALAFPYPGAFTYLDDRRLTVWEAAPVPDAPRYVGRIPGRVVGIDRGHVDVLTGDGVLRMHKVQPDGAETVEAARVIRSVRSTLSSQPLGRRSAVDLTLRPADQLSPPVG